MKNLTLNKDKVKESVVKMLSDNELVRSYIKGKTPKKIHTKKGIKLTKSL
jgi:hypothetical protein